MEVAVFRVEVDFTVWEYGFSVWKYGFFRVGVAPLSGRCVFGVPVPLTSSIANNRHRIVLGQHLKQVRFFLVP